MFLEKFKGDGEALPARPNHRSVAIAGMGGAIGIAMVAILGNSLEVALVLGSFGASCVLLFGFPNVPFSQPRNIVCGHILSSLIGLVFLTTLGPHWWSLSLAVGSAIALMMLTGTVHPPAGSNPVIVFLTQPSWGFLLFPTATGAAILVAIALFYLNLSRTERYPKYW